MELVGWNPLSRGRFKYVSSGSASSLSPFRTMTVLVTTALVAKFFGPQLLSSRRGSPELGFSALMHDYISIE
jgi:hypothetical protein